MESTFYPDIFDSGGSDFRHSKPRKHDRITERYGIVELLRGINSNPVKTADQCAAQQVAIVRLERVRVNLVHPPSWTLTQFFHIKITKLFKTSIINIVEKNTGYIVYILKAVK